MDFAKWHMLISEKNKKILPAEKNLCYFFHYHNPLGKYRVPREISFYKERARQNGKKCHVTRGGVFRERLAVDSFSALAVSSRHITAEGWLSGR